MRAAHKNVGTPFRNQASQEEHLQVRTDQATPLSIGTSPNEISQVHKKLGGSTRNLEVRNEPGQVHNTVGRAHKSVGKSVGNLTRP